MTIHSIRFAICFIKFIFITPAHCFIAMSSTNEVAPLVHLPQQPTAETSKHIVSSFQRSGFLRITTPLVPLDLQQRALAAATTHLLHGSNVVTHPTDPKTYCMLTSLEEIAQISPVLVEYSNALEQTKVVLLQCLAVGLYLEKDYFARLHSENHSSMRLLRYPAVSKDSGNRCKEHSDYGSITLLLTDGVSGLEAYQDGKWHPVTHHPGCLVVNAGSLLESWTNKRIPATLHRVAGPSSANSLSQKEDLLLGVTRDRTSIAFFADPNESAKLALQSEKRECESDSPEDVDSMSVAEYIRWRSGGDDMDGQRNGIAFTQDEKQRVER